MLLNKIFILSFWIKDNIEKILKVFVYLFMPVLVFLLIYLAIFTKASFVLDMQKWFGGFWYNLFILILFVKPISVILEKYFKVNFIRLIDFFGWFSFFIKNLFYIKTFILNILYSISKFIIGLRRPLGIATFWILFLHFILYEIKLYNIGNIDFMSFKEISLLFGLIWIIILFVAFLISNDFSVKYLGKSRKYIQQLLYIAFIWAVLHISIIESNIVWWILIIILFLVLKYFEYKKIKKTEDKLDIDTKFNQYKCNPCGYIYDENLWDPDGWIAPWTKFEDIPDTWVCPVCGVNKTFFTKIIKKNQNLVSKIIEKEMLNDSVLKLTLSVWGILNIIPWQTITLSLWNNDIELKRIYSIADYYYDWNKTNITCLIKLNKESTSSKILMWLSIDQEIDITKPSWYFKLQNTSNPKVFIATGTWLSPLFAMIKSISYFMKTKLYFGVAYKNDLFYKNIFDKIKTLTNKCFLSREELAWFECWRIDISKDKFSLNTEFYICWNPGLVWDMTKKMKEMWFNNIYFEQY